MRTTGGARPTDKTRHLTLVIHGLLDGAQGLATAASGESEETLGIKAVFVPFYSGVGDSAKAGASDLSERASDVLGQGNDVEALKILSRVLEMDPDVAATAKLDLILGGKAIGQVSLHADRRAVSVLVHPDRLKAANSYAVIEFTGENAPPTVRRALAPVEGAAYLLAEFENLPDGRFALGLEFPDF